MEYAFFFLFALVAVIAAVAMILQRNPVYSVLYLIVVMLCLAGLFLILNSEFIAILQVLVYAGAIMVLFLFVIMLLNLGEVAAAESGTVLRYQRLFGPGLAALFFVLLGVGLGQSVASGSLPQMGAVNDAGSVQQLSLAMFTAYAWPVLVTSVLLLVAMVGAVVLAKRSDD